jgi:methionyl-tRNA formyltransferase
MPKKKIKIIFMGTSWLAKEVLASLFEKSEEYRISAVFTKPDKKIGREQKIIPGPVKEFSELKKIPLFQPAKLSEEEIISEIKGMSPDLILIFAYGKIIPPSILEIPPFGCLNIHPSLLPKFRGPSPIQNVILSGEKEIGITLMKIDEKVDHGEIISQKTFPIDKDDTAETLSQKIAPVCSELAVKSIPDWIAGKIEAKKQNDEIATYCQLIEREDGHIFWNEEAEEIYNRFRAFEPWPGVFTIWENYNVLLRIKIKKMKIRESDKEKSRQLGEVFRIGNDLGVQTAKGTIVLEELQIEGKKTLPAKEFINGYPNFVGSLLK